MWAFLVFNVFSIVLVTPIPTAPVYRSRTPYSVPAFASPPTPSRTFLLLLCTPNPLSLTLSPSHPTLQVSAQVGKGAPLGSHSHPVIFCSSLPWEEQQHGPWAQVPCGAPCPLGAFCSQGVVQVLCACEGVWVDGGSAQMVGLVFCVCVCQEQALCASSHLACLPVCVPVCFLLPA